MADTMKNTAKMAVSESSSCCRGVRRGMAAGRPVLVMLARVDVSLCGN
jgi:hypothetical protein